LCGALCTSALKSGRRLTFYQGHALWSDANIALFWIRTHLSRWEVFVGNRVAAIQDLVPAKHWRYLQIPIQQILPHKRAQQKPMWWWRGSSWMKIPCKV